MNRNGHKEEKEAWCYFHPKQVVVGVCPLCLNERLLVLAAKQDHHRPFASIASHRLQSSTQRKPSASIHKIFAFGSLFTRHQFKSHYYDQDDASPSPEGKTIFYTLLSISNIAIYCQNLSSPFGYAVVYNSHKFVIHKSFISIKFEENGVASWEKGSVFSKGCVNSEVLKKEAKDSNKSVIEHGKSNNNAFRWRKRMGRLSHLIQWKRSSKGCVGHVGNKVEGVKVRKGWIRTLTKRKSVE
ncbi:hypothetical protein Fmac_031677 [Flemingia macrophylla]|uniref:Uncharacterized protein n=1 Tax=Flemingia macrophylla TaxID=520843 RepID=A0ABD1L2R8_9FABA